MPQIAGALRASVNRHTGFTPNKLMLGRELTMPADLLFPHSSVQADDEYDYVQTLESNLKEAHAVARNVLKQNVERMKKN